MQQAPTPPPAGAYPRLFSPIELGGLRLKNRIVHASISTRLGERGRLGAGYLRYCQIRAEGGAAALITEPLGLGDWQNPMRLPIYSDAHLPDLQQLAEAVRSHDCHLIGQLQDPGRGRHIPGQGQHTLAPSALPDDLSGTMPRAMSTQEVRNWVDRMAEQALRLQRAGFSGVELSACHGHLFHLFLSPRANRREDAYGGDVIGRTRWLAQMTQAIAQACGTGFAVGIKLPADDGLSDSIGPQQAKDIVAALLDQCSPDYLAFAQGAHAHSLHMHLPEAAGPHMPYAALTAELARHARGRAVMSLGRITDPAQAEALLHDPDIALIGLGRPLIADPDWPRKAAAGLLQHLLENHCPGPPDRLRQQPPLGRRAGGQALEPGTGPKAGAGDRRRRRRPGDGLGSGFARPPGTSGRRLSGRRRQGPAHGATAGAAELIEPLRLPVRAGARARRPDGTRSMAAGRRPEGFTV
jgi:2,4-dienoyl-CoA reductase-like NADH-dependent reductase (Old Yellow Enzyme family)